MKILKTTPLLRETPHPNLHTHIHTLFTTSDPAEAYPLPPSAYPSTLLPAVAAAKDAYERGLVSTSISKTWGYELP